MTKCACMRSYSGHVRLFVTPWTVDHQGPQSTGFSTQEYWSELLCPSPDLPNPGTEPAPLMSPTLGGSFYTTITTWEALNSMYSVFIVFEIYHFKIKFLQTAFSITVIFSLIMSLTLVNISKFGIIIPIFTYEEMRFRGLVK